MGITDVITGTVGSLIASYVYPKVTGEVDRRIIENTILECLEPYIQPLEQRFRAEGLSEENIIILIEQLKTLLKKLVKNPKKIIDAAFNPREIAQTIDIAPEIKVHGLEHHYRLALEQGCNGIVSCMHLLKRWEAHAWNRNFREHEEFKKILSSQKNLLESVERATVHEPVERQRAREDNYRSVLLNRKKYEVVPMGTLTMADKKHLDLETLYVHQYIKEFTQQISGKELGEIENSGISLEEMRKYIIELQTRSIGGRELLVDDVFKQNKRIVITGVPGSGKTTLVQHLFCSILLGTISFDDQESKPLALIFNLRSLKKEHLTSIENMPSRSGMLELMEGKSLSVYSDILEERALKGKLVFLLDGLDEVQEKGRDVVYQWIEELIRQYPKSYFLLTSRPYGYQSGRLYNIKIIQNNKSEYLQFGEFSLCEFEESQIEQYVRQWVTAVKLEENKTFEEAKKIGEEKSREMIKQANANPYVMHLASNPLYLSGLCLVQEYLNTKLPERRTELYDLCIMGMLQKWHKDFSDQRPLTREQGLDLLQPLALFMMENRIAEVPIERVKEIFENTNVIRKEGNTFEEILSFIKNRAGLLIERRSGFIAFSHLAFQEYLAAREMKQLYGGSEEKRWEIVASKIKDNQWNEVLRLYIILLSEMAGVVDQFADNLIKMNTFESALFVADMIIDKIKINNELEEKIATLIVDKACKGHFWHSNEDYSRLEGVLRIICENPWFSKIADDLLSKIRNWKYSDSCFSLCLILSQEALSPFFEELDKILANIVKKKGNEDLWLYIYPHIDLFPNLKDYARKIHTNLDEYLFEIPFSSLWYLCGGGGLMGPRRLGGTIALLWINISDLYLFIWFLSRDRSFSLAQDLHKSLDRTLNLVRALNLDKNLALVLSQIPDRDKYRDGAMDRAKALNLDLSIAMSFDQACLRVRDKYLARSFSIVFFQSLSRSRARNLSLALSLAIDRARDRARSLDLSMDRALDLDRTIDLAIERDLDRYLDQLISERMRNNNKPPDNIWKCELIGESREALFQRAQRMEIINCYAFQGYKMQGSEHERYINEAKEKGYCEKNSLVELQWNMYQTAINFENPDMKKIRKIGEILINPGDPEVYELLDKIGFKDIGREIVKFCEKK